MAAAHAGRTAQARTRLPAARKRSSARGSARTSGRPPAPALPAPHRRRDSARLRQQMEASCFPRCRFHPPSRARSHLLRRTAGDAQSQTHPGCGWRPLSVGAVRLPVRTAAGSGGAGLTCIFAWLPYPSAGDARPVPISFRSGRWAPCAPGNEHGSKTVMRVSAWCPSAAMLVAGLADHRRLLSGGQGDMASPDGALRRAAELHSGSCHGGALIGVTPGCDAHRVRSADQRRYQRIVNRSYFHRRAERVRQHVTSGSPGNAGRVERWRLRRYAVQSGEPGER